MRARFDWTYVVEDWPNDGSSTRTLTLKFIALGRSLTLAWHSPLRRHTGQSFEGAWLDDEDDDR